MVSYFLNFVILISTTQDLMGEVAEHFSVSPSSRLQLFMLLNVYTSQKPFHTSASVLSTHPLMHGVLNSLLLDASPTVCTTGLTVLVKLLPIFAVHACKELKQHLPQLLAVLVRMICWKDGPASNLLHSYTSALQLYDMPPEAEVSLEEEFQDDKPLHIRPDFGWARLESTFDATVSSAPSPWSLFTNLYYLFPRTTLRFLREPINCLEQWGFATPYTVSWDEALDEVKIRSKSEVM